MPEGPPAASALRSGFVLLWGAPGSGKSTLLSRLVGEEVAIATGRARTSRHRIVGVREEKGFQIVLVDVPGIAAAGDLLERALLATAKAEIEAADVVLFLADARRNPGGDDEFAASELGPVGAQVPVVLVLNKIDAAGPELASRRAEFESLRPFAATVEISAARGDGVDALLAEVKSRLPEGPPYYPEGTVTDVPEKLEIGERIREQCLLLLDQEIPYACAVLVTKLAERAGGVLHVAATIHVEKESQKAIVVGKGGATVKRIGTAARLSLEKVLGRKVYLEIDVAVAPHWRRDAAALRRFGFLVDKG